MRNTSSNQASNVKSQTISWKSRCIVILLMILCLLVITYSSREFRADLLQWEAHYIQKSWTEREELPTTEELEKSQALYRKALEWLPNYPAYHDALAYLLRLEMLTTSDPIEYEVLARESISHNKAALKYRPIWPASYSQIVIVKSLLGEFDEEWYEYYRKAFELGPWDEVNLIQLAEAGIMYWPWLQKEYQEITITSILRVINYDRAHIAYLRKKMDTYVRTEEICALISENKLVLPLSGRQMPQSFCF